MALTDEDYKILAYEAERRCAEALRELRQRDAYITSLQDKIFYLENQIVKLMQDRIDGNS